MAKVRVKKADLWKAEQYTIQGQVFTAEELDGAIVNLSYIGHPIIEGQVAEFFTEELTDHVLGELSRRSDTGEWIFVSDSWMAKLQSGLINLGTELNSVNHVFYTANGIPQEVKDYRYIAKRQRCGSLNNYRIR